MRPVQNVAPARVAALSLVAMIACGCGATGGILGRLWGESPAVSPAAAPGTLEIPAEGLPSGAVRVVLVWSDPVDLDLYVTDPALETVYFANSPSGTEGRLERDTQCDDVAAAGSRLEIVTWKEARPGRYRVGVDFMDACGSTDETVPFKVRAEGGAEPVEKSGNARLERFEPVVLEFDVPGESGGQSPAAGRSE